MKSKTTSSVDVEHAGIVITSHAHISTVRIVMPYGAIINDIDIMAAGEVNYCDVREAILISRLDDETVCVDVR